MPNATYTLDKLPMYTIGTVERITSPPAMKERLEDLGLIHGAEICPTAESYSGDIRVYTLCGASIAIRDVDAKTVYLKGEGTDAKPKFN